MSIAWIEPKPHATSPFARVKAELEREHAVQGFSTLADAADRIDAQRVVLAVSREGEFAEKQCEHLAKNCDSVCVLLGDWCCGLKRRLPSARSYAVRYAHEIKAGFAFRQLFDGAIQPNENTSELVAVYTRSRSYRDALQTLLREAGSKSVGLEFGDNVHTTGVENVVWEASPHQAERHEELQEIRARHPDARVIALLTFPREFEIAFYSEDGVLAIPQPISIAELLCHIKKPAAEQRLRISA